MIAFVLSFVLSATAGLSGTVVDASGGVLPGVTVVVLDAQHRPTAQKAVTNSAGEFAFDNVSLPVEVEISLSGFVTRRIEVTASPVTLALELGPFTTGLVAEAPVSRSPSWRDATTGATTLTKTDLERVPAMTPDESLKVISGFSLFRRSSSRASNPTTHGVTMRGLSASGASRALVAFSGLPLNDGFGGWVTWERLPSLAIGQITVQRGPMGDIFGSDALGGAITLSAPAARSRSAEFSAEVASLDTRALSASGGRVARNASFFGAAGWFESDGFIPVEPATRGTVDAAMDTTWRNAFGRAVFGQTRRLTLSGWGGSDERGNGTVVQRNASHGGTGTAAFEMATGPTQFSARVASSMNRYEQNFTAVFPVAGVGRSGERLTSTQHIDTDVLRAIVDVRRSIPKGAASVRASVVRTDSDFEDAQAATTIAKTLIDNSQSISAQIAVAPVAALTLSAGGRAEWRSAGNESAPVSPDPAAVGRVSAAWTLNGVFTARAAAATSHRWPTLNELVRNFSAGTVTTVANPDLEPERARSIEGGVDASFDATYGRYQFAITGFRSMVDSAIANVTTSVVGSTITRQRQNAGEAHASGVELDASANTTWIRVRASATVLNAKFRESKEPALEGKWLPQVPRVSAGGSVDLLLPKAHVASLIVHGVSMQFDDDRNTAAFRMTKATQIDARVGGEIRFASWYIAAENLADARIETGRSGSPTAPLVTLAQGRAIRAGLTIRLK